MARIKGVDIPNNKRIEIRCVNRKHNQRQG